ncbi:hypothetical protein GEMRC1_010556 [Eukaryota sp. GEM-RC1]
MEKASSSLPTPNSLSPLTLRYATELCRAVMFLHLKSIVHGDLKPANILLVDDHVRVADFGTSKNLAATTLISKANAMTPKYAAPEQFDSNAVPASDIYSLGMVLYELLTGKEAFKGFQMLQLFGAKMRGTSLPFDKSTPQYLQELITNCLNTEPSSRLNINEIIEILNSNVPEFDTNSSSSSDSDSEPYVQHDYLNFDISIDVEIATLVKISSFGSDLTVMHSILSIYSNFKMPKVVKGRDFLYSDVPAGVPDIVILVRTDRNTLFGGYFPKGLNSNNSTSAVTFLFHLGPNKPKAFPVKVEGATGGFSVGEYISPPYRDLALANGGFGRENLGVVYQGTPGELVPEIDFKIDTIEIYQCELSMKVAF